MHWTRITFTEVMIEVELPRSAEVWISDDDSAGRIRYVGAIGAAR